MHEPRRVAEATAEPFREYYLAIAKARTALGGYLHNFGEHHFFVSGAEPVDVEVQGAAAADELEEDMIDVGNYAGDDGES